MLKEVNGEWSEHEKDHKGNPPVHQSHYKLELAFTAEHYILKKNWFIANLLAFTSKMWGTLTAFDMHRNIPAQPIHTSNNSHSHVCIDLALRRCTVSAFSFSFICWIKEALNQSFILVVKISSLV